MRGMKEGVIERIRGEIKELEEKIKGIQGKKDAIYSRIKDVMECLKMRVEGEENEIKLGKEKGIVIKKPAQLVFMEDDGDVEEILITFKNGKFIAIGIEMERDWDCGCDLHFHVNNWKVTGQYYVEHPLVPEKVRSELKALQEKDNELDRALRTRKRYIERIECAVKLEEVYGQ
jgi:hypothetical protein